MLSTLAASNWDRAKASLLLQRAGFGGTPDEVDTLAAVSPAEAAESLLGPSQLVAPEPPTFLSEPDLKELEEYINSLKERQTSTPSFNRPHNYRLCYVCRYSGIFPARVVLSKTAYRNQVFSSS